MVLNTCHVHGNMHGNDKQMRLLYIIKRGVVSSIHGDFCEEMHVHTIFPWLGFIKGFYRRFWRTHAFINLKTFLRTQNLALVRTFRMKSTESFTHEVPDHSNEDPRRVRSTFI